MTMFPKPKDARAKALKDKLVLLRKKIAPLKKELGVILSREKVNRKARVKRKEQREKSAKNVWRCDSDSLTGNLGNGLPHRCSYYWHGSYYDDYDHTYAHYIHRCQMGGSICHKPTGLYFCLRHARVLWPREYGINPGPRRSTKQKKERP